MEPQKYSAQDIANWFVLYNQKFVDEGEAELITPLKLQKLLYYAQATFLAIKDEALFEDEIYKWEFGPVVPTLYKKYSDLGARGIEPTSVDTGGTKKVDDFYEQLLEASYEKYNRFSAYGLSEKTHSETPWQRTKRNEIISKQAIQEYFKKNVYVDEKLFAEIPCQSEFPRKWYDASEDSFWESYVK
ncbi:MAG: DUF4065 domain-containing protein [Clostridiales Family XIII bacterium]|jgi:uncharacterized phage-associated protein|nr:DUF4065 domain-containing protein [Clostridiales Family XIII bacterium]